MKAAAAVGNPQDAVKVNMLARQFLRQRAIERVVPLAPVVPNAQQIAGGVINIQPNMAGLLKKFIIEITGTANNTDAANVANLSDIGIANIINNVTFTDSNGVVRTQPSGWQMDFVFRAKHRWGAGSSLLSTALNQSGNFGNNFGVTVAPTGFAHATSQAFRMVWELPICYSDEDFSGAVWLGIVNSPAQLSIILNSAPFAAAGVDSTLAAWKGAAGNLTNVTIQVYQVYLDQIGPQQLPPLDMRKAYELKFTNNQQAFQAGQDNPYSYSNFRRFLSTFLIYNHDPSADAGRAAGTDINYFSLQSASAVPIWKKFPLQVAREARVHTLTDYPLGCYYFSTRRPNAQINTVNFGNVNLILNPITAAAGAYALIGLEDFAELNALRQASSISG